MNKRFIPGVIVVEGKHDVSRLSLLYESIYVVTNGYEIPQNDKKFLILSADKFPVYILTDNDEAGNFIRKKLNSLKNNFINILISAPRDSKKKGIAECDINDIKNALDKYSVEYIEKPHLDLYKLGLIGQKNSKYLREYICDKFNLGICSTKEMVKRLELLNINEDMIKKEIDHASC